MNNSLIEILQKFNFLLVSWQFIGRFQDHGLAHKFRMIDNSPEGLDTQTTRTDAFMAVLMAGKGILGIVQMQCPELVQAHDPVKFIQNPIQIMDNVITRIVDMAGIQTNADILTSHRIDDGLQLLKSAAYFTSLSCHGLKQDRHRIAGFQGFLQSLGDVINAGFRSLSNMAAGMKIIVLSGKRRHSTQIVTQDIAGEGSGFRICGAKVHGIGTMGNQLTESLFLQRFHRCGTILPILFPVFGTPGIPGKKRKCIGPDLLRRPNHGKISLGGRQMTTDIFHSKHLLEICIIPHTIPKCKQAHPDDAPNCLFPCT